MLALMYAGELCYWAWEVEGGSLSKEEEEEDGAERKGEREKVTEAEEEGEGGSQLVRGQRQEDDSTAKDRVTGVAGITAHGPQLQPRPPLFSSLLSEINGVEHVQQYCKSFSPAASGQSFLQRYIALAQGPLKDHNWNYARAVELLELLKT